MQLDQAEIRLTHKVSLKHCCLPKTEGSLGLKTLEDMGKVASLKLLWHIITDRTSIWNEWIKTNLLRGNTLWDTSATYDSSVRWKNLLNTRKELRERIRMRIGDGCSTSICRDWWCGEGPLSHIHEVRMSRVFSEGYITHVYQIIRDGEWNLSNLDMSEEIKAIISSTRIFRGNSNYPVWTPAEASGFTSKSAWESIRERGQSGPWKNLLWFKGHVPKFSFTTWLVSLNRLTTRDRLRAWNIEVDPCYPLCNRLPETRNHIFYACDYSRSILESGEGAMIKNLHIHGYQ